MSPFLVTETTGEGAESSCTMGGAKSWCSRAQPAAATPSKALAFAGTGFCEGVMVAGRRVWTQTSPRLSLSCF